MGLQEFKLKLSTLSDVVIIEEVEDANLGLEDHLTYIVGEFRHLKNSHT